MSWVVEKLAHPMGYQYAVLFPRARDAVGAYVKLTGKKLTLPANICPALEPFAEKFLPVSPHTGLNTLPVHLYGYRAEHGPADLTLDPLMTGWGRRPETPSCIVSFGRNKFVSINHGGAFLTNDSALAEAIEPLGHWPFPSESNESYLLQSWLAGFRNIHIRRFDRIEAWDAALGDLLLKLDGEQVIPWRVMRRADHCCPRDRIAWALRAKGIPIGTNYKSLLGDEDPWGKSVIYFFPDCERETEAAEIIDGVMRHG